MIYIYLLYILTCTDLVVTNVKHFHIIFFNITKKRLIEF